MGVNKIYNTEGVPSARIVNDHDFDIAMGLIAYKRRFSRFGFNSDVNTEEDIWSGGGLYPWPETAERFRVAANGDPADDVNGDGARNVIIQYLDEDWLQKIEILDTAGASASAFTVGKGYRLIRAFNTKVGLFGGKNIGIIKIEHENTDAVIGHISAGQGITQMSQYTVPANEFGFLFNLLMTVSTGNAGNIKVFTRLNANNLVAPFGATHLAASFDDIIGTIPKSGISARIAPFTDIWFTGEKVSGGGNASFSINYDLRLVETSFLVE